MDMKKIYVVYVYICIIVKLFDYVVSFYNINLVDKFDEG